MNSDFPPPRAIKFLLVDDQEANLLALRSLLKREGLELHEATSGTEALELLLVHDFALAILDIQMPGMDGFELAQLMRGTERTRQVPIIFLTAGGTSDQSRRFQGYETGAVDFLFKPVEAHILRSKAGVFFDLAVEREKLQVSERQLREANRELTQLVEELQIARRAAVTGMEEAVAARELAETATRAKDQFLSTLSHELRTPLNPALLLATELQADASLPPAARDDLRMIVQGITLQVCLIDDLLDLTRISGGKLKLDLRVVDLHAALQQSVEMMRAEAATRAITITTDLLAAQCEVMADPVRMQQVFWNVLRNAAKFSPQGGRIAVSSFNAEGRPGAFVVEIRDEGVGISPDMLERIFDPFVQDTREGGTRSGGLGLGLAITRSLVQFQHGRVAAKSEGQNKGATFRIEFPLAGETPLTTYTTEPATGDGAVAAPPAPPVPVPVPVQKHLLLVEDHDETRRALEKLLTRRGYRVTAVGRADAALETAARETIDVVVSDLDLPDSDGHSLMAELHKRHGMPGIAMSGFGSAEDIRRSHASGFRLHLVKPLNIRWLEEAISKVLGSPEV